MENITHLLPVFTAVILLGLPIASYFFFTYTYHNNYQISDFTLKLFTSADAIILLPLTLFVTMTGFMINASLSTQWILSSFILQIMVMLCIILNVSLKIRYYVSLTFTGIYKLNKLFHLTNILQIALLILITHDTMFRPSWIGSW